MFATVTNILLIINCQLFSSTLVLSLTFSFLLDDDVKDRYLSNGSISNGSSETGNQKSSRKGNERPLRDLFTLYSGERARHGWRVEVKPHNETLANFEFDAIVDATGKSNSCLSKSYINLRYNLQLFV